MNEKRTDARRFARGIQFRIITTGLMIASEKRFAFAPATAANQLAITCHAGVGRRRGFNGEVSCVADQLSIDAEDRAERALDLRGRIIIRAQAAGRERN